MNDKKESIDQLRKDIDMLVANQANLIKGHELIVARINTLTMLVEQAIAKKGEDES